MVSYQKLENIFEVLIYNKGCHSLKQKSKLKLHQDVHKKKILSKI